MMATKDIALRHGPLRLRELVRQAKIKAPAHKPDFKARTVEEFIAISDGDRPVALLHRDWLVLDMREFYPDGRARATFDIRRPYHSPGMLGTTLVCNWRLHGEQKVCSKKHTISIRGGGPTLTLRIAETFGPEETGYHELTFYWDQDLGCYGVETTAEVWLHQPCLMVASNIWSRGVGEAWPEDSTFDYTLWTNRTGGLTYFWHNPLTPNLPGNMDLGRRSIPVGGFLGFGSRAQSNPVLEVTGSHSEALSWMTCSCWYDEHFAMCCPEPPDADGRYRWAVRYRLVSLPQPFMAKLREQAQMLEFGATAENYDSWSYLDAIRHAGRQIQPFDQAVPFVPGQVNDCESVIDPRQRQHGHYWLFGSQPFGKVSWDQACGYRSRASLLLTGRTVQAEVKTYPCGPSIPLKPGHRYRLSAMVKTELVGRAAAWLELSPFFWSPREIKRPRTSLRLTGTNGWTKLDVIVPPAPGKDFLCLNLCLRGQGRAWFDKILLKRE